jgi:hypothetical protein
MKWSYKMPITIRRTASALEAEIKIDHTTTTVDLSKMPLQDRARIVRELFRWRNNHYKGYPILN